MNQIFQQIKSVSGVSGIIVLDKQNSTTYQLLPASFSANLIKSLGMSLKEISRNWPDVNQLQIKFNSGYGRLINTPSSIIYILTKMDIFFADLNLVLKSAVPQIEKKVGAANPFGRLETEQVLVEKKINLDLWLAALNLVTNKYREQLGAYTVTQHLRKAKERIVDTFPGLANFYVGNQGRVSYVQTVADSNQAQLQEGIARWVYYLKGFCDASAPALSDTDIKELTTELRSELAREGFYHWYDTISVG